MHYTTAAEAVKLIRSNDSVYIQGSTSIPEALVAAMAERGGELEHVTVYSAFAVGAFDAPYCRPEYKESFLVNSLFVANNIRRWLADGYGQLSGSSSWNWVMPSLPTSAMKKRWLYTISMQKRH